MDLEGRFAVSQDERNNELQMFREKWRQELNATNAPLSSPDKENFPTEHANEGARSKIEIAAEIFREGIKEERNGRLYEAVALYRHAMQLDPDIEFKMEKNPELRVKLRVNEKENPGVFADDEVDQESFLIDHLMFYNVHLYGSCSPEVPTGGTHISALPCEIMQHLTLWLVSAELDMLSLEQFSKVCRGFYRIARDDRIWQLACKRMWGAMCGKPEDFNFVSWRQMLIQRPQVRFNGIYISRVTYIRAGETSFVDQNTHYLPWYNVTYYRYLRFFSDGTVLYVNTPDEPLQVVPRLRTKPTPVKDATNQILVGFYRLTSDGEGVLVHLERDIFRDEGGNRPHRYRRKKKDGIETLLMEMSIRNNRERLHMRLDFRRYSITRKIGNTENQSFMDINQHFPSCYFSRVKSYTSTAEQPLT